MITNIIKTPVGEFTRKSATRYLFAAVIEAAEKPEEGLRVVGNRKGDKDLGKALPYGDKTYIEPRVRYHIVWSRSAAGAQKNGEGYVWAKARVVGVYPVEAL